MCQISYQSKNQKSVKNALCQHQTQYNKKVFGSVFCLSEHSAKWTYEVLTQSQRYVMQQFYDHETFYDVLTFQ